MRRRRDSAGFTLLEAMIAAGILVIGIVGVVGLQGMLFQSARYSQDMSAAAHLLNYRAEELSSYGIAKLDGPPAICAGAAPGCLAPGSTYAPLPASGCSQNVIDPLPYNAGSPGGPYRIDTGIVAHSSADHATARVATISVCWADSGGRVRQMQATRVIGDR